MKKWSIIIFCVMLVLSLTACASGGLTTSDAILDETDTIIAETTAVTTSRTTTITTTTARPTTTTTTTMRPTTTTQRPTTTTQRPTTTATTKPPQKTYSVGETFVVPGQYEFTVLSATRHYHCNSLWDNTDGLSGNEEIVIVEYAYKNIGCDSGGDGLYMDTLHFNVYDEEGEVADTYACTHTRSARFCVVGTRCTASIAFTLTNPSSKILLAGNSGLYDFYARFEIPIT